MMFSYNRREEIINYLKDRKSASVEEISKKIYCSPSTVRRDLDQLQKEGRVRRTRGGVILIEDNHFELPFNFRSFDNYDKKNQIAETAKQLVKEDMTIFIDSSSTCMCLAKKLKPIKNLKVLTNNPLLAYDLSQNTEIETYCVGGRILPKSCTIQGSTACRFLMQFHSDIVFLGSRGFDVQKGPTDFSDDSAQIKYFYSINSTKTVLLIDSTKFNKSYNYSGLDFNMIDTLITDKQPDVSISNTCLKHNIDILY